MLDEITKQSDKIMKLQFTVVWVMLCKSNSLECNPCKQEFQSQIYYFISISWKIHSATKHLKQILWRMIKFLISVFFCVGYDMTGKTWATYDCQDGASVFHRSFSIAASLERSSLVIASISFVFPKDCRVRSDNMEVSLQRSPVKIDSNDHREPGYGTIL